ncbi:Kinase-interacting protein 1 [Camellia lanceoleosa]|uniref:Kinase-interacting protein 1 n=1 Tax=Camellia lanceoleosa TaxID=1840588 RepID=A0ACC0I229_9ERIC|nr:Kinase-interacting protein 1 [Camellia lanceoleosa]
MLGTPKNPRTELLNPYRGPANNNVPKIPKYPTRDLKGLLISASKKLQAKKTIEASKTNRNKTGPKSGLSESEAVEEIDKVQKEILALQTVKVFVKSSYKSGLTKYWEIDHQITKLQKRVFSLQDELSVGKVIEDDEAQTLMAEAALKSCEETLTQLKEKQEKSTKEAKSEFRKPLIDGLKTETDDFQAQIQTLEDDKATLIDDMNTLTNKLSLDHLSEKLQGTKLEDEHEHTESIQEEQEEESPLLK